MSERMTKERLEDLYMKLRYAIGWPIHPALPVLHDELVAEWARYDALKAEYDKLTVSEGCARFVEAVARHGEETDEQTELS